MSQGGEEEGEGRKRKKLMSDLQEENRQGEEIEELQVLETNITKNAKVGGGEGGGEVEIVGVGKESSSSIFLSKLCKWEANSFLSLNSKFAEIVLLKEVTLPLSHSSRTFLSFFSLSLFSLHFFLVNLEKKTAIRT